MLLIVPRRVYVAAYWEIAAHSAYYMFPKYKNLIVNLVFLPHLGV